MLRRIASSCLGCRYRFSGRRGSFPVAGGGGKIGVGDRVKVRAGITPAYGWGQAKGAVGTVRTVSGESCTIDFPGQKSWSGKVSEMERA